MTNRRIALAALAAGVLTVAACGSDDDNATSSTADTATETTTAETTTVETTAPNGGPTVDQATLDDAAAAFLEEQAAQGVTALYVGISDPVAGDLISAYGTASADGPEATVDDHFRIGSVTKSVTATVILQLVDSGDIALDDTAGELVPELAAANPEIEGLTVEQLLGMTSGISDFLNDTDVVLPDVVADPTKVWTAEELVAAGIEAGVAEPGTAGYSSTNYVILQSIAEAVTGSSLQDLIAENVAGRLDLPTFVLPPNDDTSLADPVTHGYVDGACVDEVARDGATVEPGTDTTDWNASFTQGAGGMSSTIGDLLGWAVSGNGNSILEPETADLRTSSTKTLAEGIPYGLGVIEFGSWLGHTGEAVGWEAVSITDPDTGVSIAMAGNGCGGVYLGFFAIVEALYPGTLG